jgi:hypothetical protein
MQLIQLKGKTMGAVHGLKADVDKIKERTHR